jgi:hypothetical protein
MQYELKPIKFDPSIMAELESFDVGKHIINKVITDFEKKIEKYLMACLQALALEPSEETMKRISKVSQEGNPDFFRFYLDYDKPTELMLAEVRLNNYGVKFESSNCSPKYTMEGVITGVLKDFNFD